MGVLSLSAVLGQAQVAATATPQSTRDLSLTSSISTQAADLLPGAGEQLSTVTDIESGVGSALSGNSLTFSEASLTTAVTNASVAGQEPVLAQQEGRNSGSTPDSPPTEDPNAGLRIPLNLAEGLPIQQVYIYLRNSTGDVEQDEALRQQLASTFRIRAGGNFSRLFADQALNEVQQLPFVESAEYRVYESNLPGPVIVALLVTLQSEPPKAEQPSGIIASGSFQDFPTLYQSDRALVKFILNGGIGVFSDTNPWFGNADNFVAGPYQPTGTITWGEAYLEPGLAGITQVGDDPFYLYGAGTYTLSTTVQPDIFRTDDRYDN